MATLGSPYASRVPFQFLSADAPSLNVTGATSLVNNPYAMYIQAGNVAKVQMGINGTSYFQGDGEFAPFAIDLEWKSMVFADYAKLAALRPYPITMITHRNNGFYGKLVLDGPNSDRPHAGDIISNKAVFYTLAPSDAGGANAVNRITAPTVAVAGGTSGSGWIPASTTLYYWLTFSSIWGETTAGTISNTTTGAGPSANTLTWTWPASTAYCTQATLYCNNVNNAATSKLMAQVLNGETATWIDTVGSNGCTLNQQPPSASTAYRGAWQGGLWTNEP